MDQKVRASGNLLPAVHAPSNKCTELDRLPRVNHDQALIYSPKFLTKYNNEHFSLRPSQRDYA